MVQSEPKMEKQKLTITVGRESSQEELDAVRDAFSENFQAEVENTYMRCSLDDLPMAVLIFLGDVVWKGAIYDLLKSSIMKFLNDKRLKRKPCVTIRTEREMVSFTKEGVSIQKNMEFKKFDSIEAFEVYLKKVKEDDAPK